MDQYNILQALENSPKGRLSYDTGWDESPNAITSLITSVQELEVDKPKRKIVENAFKIVQMKERYSLSPRTSPNTKVPSRGRHSLPGNVVETAKKEEQSAMSKTLLSCLTRLKETRERLDLKLKYAKRSSLSPTRTNNSYPPQPEVRIEEVSINSNWSAVDSASEKVSRNDFILRDKKRLIPPEIRRKRSFGGSPHFKPSPYSSSTHTQTHSSTTSASEATNTTPTRQPTGKCKKYGIGEEALPNVDKMEEDLLLESKASPYILIEEVNAKYQVLLERNVIEATFQRALRFKEQDKETERKALEAEALAIKLRKEQDETLKKQWAETERANLYDVESRQKSRSQQEEKLQLERKAALDAAERSRQAIEEAAKQEQLRIQKSYEDEQRRKEESERLEQQRLNEQKVAEERIRAETAVAEAKQKLEDQKKAHQVVPELNGLILKDDLTTFARTTELLKQFEAPVSHIDGKNPATKAFYIGAVKCINTPLNALADTTEKEILEKVQHFSKLLSGESVLGGGSMTTPFSSTSIPQGDLFVMKILAYRFVKKSEADVTRGTSTVQPLATVGVHLCKRFPVWAALVQADLYKLCPFLVPFSYPQGDKSIQEYAKELGHDLSGSETAIQQTFLERLKGYCTLYALMVLRFSDEGSFEIGETTDFFTIGGAWKILVKTIKLEPQVDVTATIIHTLLVILDDRLYATYRGQFTKFIRLFIALFLPKIKSITPPAKSGSLSRLQIYLEKKYSA